MDEERVAHVLVVEDEVDYRDIVCEFLTSAGYEVTAVGDVAGAREAIRTRRPDVAILDLQLPDGTGFDVAAELKALGIDVPIIACSGDHDSVGRAQLDSRFLGVYPKPCSLAEVVEAVGRALGGNSRTTQPA